MNVENCNDLTCDNCPNCRGYDAYWASLAEINAERLAVAQLDYQYDEDKAAMRAAYIAPALDIAHYNAQPNDHIPF